MKFFRIFFLTIIITSPIVARSLKILHISFHQGCLNDFEHIAKELGHEVTSWNIGKLGAEFEGRPYSNTTYTINHARAERIWNKHKDFFNTFDVMVTSDTAPLARIFLQDNNWKKPLIIWICNRFDYYDQAGTDGGFPDEEFYNLFRKAALQENVAIVNYTWFEHIYALQKGVNTGDLLIKPCGSTPQSFDLQNSAIPSHIDKASTFFIPSRFDSQQQIDHLLNKCREAGINAYCGPYNGPEDIADFKGIIHFPYAWSNIALFENMQRGLVHFIPSFNFATQLFNSHERSKYRFLEAGMSEQFRASEWYNGDNNEGIVYFDSWKDLKNKIQHFDFVASRIRIKKFGNYHRLTMLNRWQALFKKAEELLNK